MNKITADHLLRAAYVYVRQSTTDQLAHNPESRRRQYALKERAEALGWQNVVVIDDDLGRSGGGVARKGFERLLVAIGAGNAGAVLAIEASRLARNGRDWHTLLEFCALVYSQNSNLSIKSISLISQSDPFFGTQPIQDNGLPRKDSGLGLDKRKSCPIDYRLS